MSIIVNEEQKQTGIFDEQFRLDKLSQQKDPLVKLCNALKWEQFRGILTNAFENTEKGIGGRPPFDYVMMFKILVLQPYSNLSEEQVQVQFQILDRLSFMCFSGRVTKRANPCLATVPTRGKHRIKQ